MDDEDVQRLIELIQRQAIEILAFPESEREDRYKAIHQSITVASKSTGSSPSFAEKQAFPFVEFVREMIGFIDKEGCADG